MAVKSGKNAYTSPMPSKKTVDWSKSSPMPNKATVDWSKSSPKTAPESTVQDYDLNALYNLYGGGSGSGGGGGYSVMKADISGLLSAYDQQAESAKQAAETRYSNTRNDLLTSLKRFQEENARNVENQKTSYLTEQASLESAREQANRQNRISAAARGLGGSGLQQLAQLQNLIGQSEQVSRSAGTNQEAMDKLATLLRNYEEDSDTKMKQNEDERLNTINSIASTLAAQKAAAIAQNEQNYVNAVNAARAQAAAARASGSSNNASARQAANAAAGALTMLQSNLKNEIKEASNMSKSELKNTYGSSDLSKVKSTINKAYIANLADLQASYALDSKTINTAQNNINSLLNGLSFKNASSSSNNTFSNTFTNQILKLIPSAFRGI